MSRDAPTQGMDADEVIRKIKAVEIQGATSIAEAGISLLQEMADDGVSMAERERVAERLRNARPTEPFLFNAIDVAHGSQDYQYVLEHIQTSQEKITKHAQEFLVGGATVYTHCHSSTVTGILTGSHPELDIAARVTETRPLYQGRETARELAADGVPVELYVDAAGRIALKEADVMLIGADAITAAGKVINKIGSELFAEVANEKDVPVYVCTDAWKFDPRSRFGFSTDLERRGGAEVWPDAPDGVDIVNYAFEQVAPDLVTGIVSELGVHEPDAFVDAVESSYPELSAD